MNYFIHDAKTGILNKGYGFNSIIGIELDSSLKTFLGKGLYFNQNNMFIIDAKTYVN